MFVKRASSLLKSYGVMHYSKKTQLIEDDNMFILRMKGFREEDSHCLNKELLKSLRSELKVVKSKATNGSVLITTAEGKRFCTGFSPIDGNDEVIDLFRELVMDLISLPMPTFAAINGEARNAGLILAMSHDHLTMKPNENVLYMTELERKMPLPEYFASVIRSKVMPGALCRLPLSTVPYNYEDAKNMGLSVHPVHGEENTVQAAERVANNLFTGNWDGNVYAEMRKTLYPDLCKALGKSGEPSSEQSKTSS